MPRFFLTILIVVGIYYGFKFLFRYLFPVLMKRFINKVGQNQFGQQAQETHKPEGEVTITPNKKSQTNKLKDSGEYVDYEEIDD
jgi:hypothetical protein